MADEKTCAICRAQRAASRLSATVVEAVEFTAICILKESYARGGPAAVAADLCPDHVRLAFYATLPDSPAEKAS